MFNPRTYANSRGDGFGVLEVLGAGVVPEGEQRFVPLRQSTLTGTVAGPLAALTLTQVFAFKRREYDGVLEAAYRFPLPGDAAVRGVRVTFGDVEIRAELQPRAQAEAAYDAAKQAGHQAALVTREAPDVFTLHVTGIKPDQAIEIATDYVQLAQADGLAWRLRLPLTTAPRYVREDDLHTAHAKGQPLAVLRDPGHRFLMDMTFYAIASVTSPTHELELTADDGRLRVQLAAGEVVPDRDCVLQWQPAQRETEPTLSVFTQHDGEHTYFFALVAPPAEPGHAVARESIVLLDHSGSMQGPKWRAADWAVEQLFLDLTRQDRFDLCLFHTTTAWFSPAPLVAERARVDDAVAWLKSRKDSGGTNLGVALEEALLLPRELPAGDKPEHEMPARNVLIVTDAAVTDSGRILRLADQEAQHAARRRISVLCIDEAPNAFLANELAARGGGAAVFLTSDPDAEDITTALESVLTTWSAPALTDLRVSVPGATVEGADGNRLQGEGTAAALALGDLPAGGTRWVAGRVARHDDGPLTVRLEQDAHVAAEVTVSSHDAHDHDAIKPLFGVRRINGLEFLATARYSDDAQREQLQRLGYDPAAVLPESTAGVYAETQARRTQDALRQLLTAESLRYGLLASTTGFVAVRTEAGHTVDRQVVIANALPAGWSPEFVTMRSAPGVYAMRASPAGVPRGAGIAEGGPNALSMPMPPAMVASVDAPFAGVPRGGGMPQWRELFRGTLPPGAENLLFDATDAGDAGGRTELISGLRVTLPGDARAELSGADLSGVTLLLYVGDPALPRARVRLTDLLRSSPRPLNLTRRPGDLLRLVLVDPDGRLAPGQVDAVIELQIQRA